MSSVFLIRNYLSAATVFIIGLCLFTNNVEAKIVVEGDRAFTDDVQACLLTYGNVPGILGDALRELEQSEHTHKIIESQDWSNTPHDGAKAKNGEGTGTVSRVSNEEYEKNKHGLVELKYKDFCASLLHELWHAVDADRGGWSEEKKNNVYVDEIEATIFQNYIHALQGVPPRTHYTHDISEFLMLTESERAVTPVEALVIDGQFFPKLQFDIVGIHEPWCADEHYHAHTAYGLKTKAGLDIVSKEDPDPEHCGFGAVPAVPVETIQLNVSQVYEFSQQGLDIR